MPSSPSSQTVGGRWHQALESEGDTEGQLAEAAEAHLEPPSPAAPLLLRSSVRKGKPRTS